MPICNFIITYAQNCKLRWKVKHLSTEVLAYLGIVDQEDRLMCGRELEEMSNSGNYPLSKNC